MSDDGTQFSVSLKYHIGDNEFLNFYDGTASLFGLAKAMQISSHAGVTGEIKFQAPHANAADVYMDRSRKGSFVQDVIIFITNQYTVAGLSGLSLTVPLMQDFIQYSFGRACGKQTRPRDPRVFDILSNDGAFDALSEALDGPLTEMHRIAHFRGIDSSFLVDNQPVLYFDQESYRNLTELIYVNEEESIQGSIASLNANSKKGRIFDFELGRTIPFELSRESDIQNFEVLSRSLDRYARGSESTVEMSVRRVKNRVQNTKKYYLVSIAR